MDTIRTGLLVATVCLLAYLLFWPVPVDPVAWNPPENPGLTGKYSSNQKLRSAERIEVPGTGPEDVVVRNGRIITGLEDGRIVERQPDGSFRTIARTEGRPLGLALGPDNELYVADAFQGLLKLAHNDELVTLVDADGPKTLGLTNHVTVTSSGTVYFTDSSRNFNYHEIKLSVIDHRADGRVLRYNPSTGKTRVLADGLVFANGVALSEDENSLYVNDMGRYRILEVDLRQEAYGDSTVFVDELPGFPDNINRGPQGTLWVGFATLRNGLLDALGPYPFLRSMLVRFPEVLRPAAVRHGMVLGFDRNGELRTNLQDETGNVAFTASAVPHEKFLYLGSYREPVLRRVKLPEAATEIE